MKKIPILFLKDDDILIEMYKNYFEARGYSSIIIRGGRQGLEQAIEAGPSLVTFDSYKMTTGTKGKSFVLIFTYLGTEECNDSPEVKSAVMSSEIFSSIENALGCSNPNK